MKTLTATEQKRYDEIQKTLPKGMKDVGHTAEQCVEKLMKQGKSQREAEDMVIEIINECGYQLKTKQYLTVIATLKMVFLDVSVEEAAKPIIASILN